ncbi:MAG: FRG domain-containing protein [Hyphomicrobiaceae bacterium]
MQQGNILFKQLSSCSASSFVSTLDTLWSRSRSGSQLIWRGVGRSSYPLTPAAARDQEAGRLEAISQLDTGEALEITGSMQEPDRADILAAYQEWSALIHFCRNANRQALAIPTWVPDALHKALTLATDESFQHSLLGTLGNATAWWPPGGLWPTLGLAQHYGIPTRLLDWSDDPMVAAYFAATSAVNDILNRAADRHTALSVWMLSATTLGRISLLDDNSRGPKAEGMRANLDFEVHVIDAPYSGNPNLAAQRGRFTLVVKKTGGLDRRCLSEVLSDIDEKLRTLENRKLALGHSANSLSDLLMRFDLPTEAAPELLSILRLRGYDANRLFPGYGGAARAAIEATNAIRAGRER